MKKLYTLSLILLGFVTAGAQTIYQENFGTPASGNTAIASYTGWQATGVTYSGTADVRSSLPSTGYTGASASGLTFITSVADRYFQVEGINTSAYNTANLVLTFGQHQTPASATAPDNLKVEVSTDGTNFTALPYSRTSTTASWELITISSGIPSTSNLRLRFRQTTTTIQYRIDDIKLANVAANCTIALQPATTTCDATTFGTDTYTATIHYTGGGNAQYTVNATAGTVSGSNPATTAEGDIIVSGVTENTNVTVTISSSADCSQSITVNGVYCKPVNTLPYYESFDYTAGTGLSTTQRWWGANTGDDILVTEGSLSYTGLAASQGKSVTFAGAGLDDYTQFTTQTEGTLFTSFLFNVTDLATMTATDPQTYFAGWLGENSNSTYRGRLFVKKSSDQYLIGFDGAATTSNYTASAYNANSTVLVVSSYNFSTGTFNVWINPSIASLTVNTTPTLTTTLTTPAANIGGFMLRQDSDTTTPAINFDELRIGTTLASVLTNTASVATNEIDGLKVFPNPLNGNTLNITSNSNAVKAIAIYDVLGKQVFTGNTVNSTVNVNLTTGIYIVKITEGNKTATRKLAVK